MYLIEIYGDCQNVEITPIIAREFSTTEIFDISVNLDAIHKYGYEGLIRFDSRLTSTFGITGFVAGEETKVVVKKQYIWQRVNLQANVPIEVRCDIGWWGSVVKWLV
jgi:hypothetical protein